jgi:DNA-binding HxlR family transcriptional regulator
MSDGAYVEVAVLRPLTSAGSKHSAGRARDSDARRPPRGDFELIDSVNRTLGPLQGKWKVHLLFFMARGIHRHSRLLDCLPGASKKVMIDTLRALERDGLVAREIFAEVPVRVEYSLTSLGWTITEPLMALAEWGQAHAGEVADARSHSESRGSNGFESPHAPERTAAA